MGFCKDVGQAGIRAEFDDPITVGSSGLLILRPPAGVLELHAQVAYIEKRQVGLLFLFETSWERRMTIEFIASIGLFPRYFTGFDSLAAFGGTSAVSAGAGFSSVGGGKDPLLMYSAGCPGLSMF